MSTHTAVSISIKEALLLVGSKKIEVPCMTSEPYDYPLIEYTLLNTKVERDNKRSTNLPRD